MRVRVLCSCTSDHTLRSARTRLRNARTQSQGAYMRYTQALDSERIAEQEVIRNEERLHELCTWLFLPNLAYVSAGQNTPPSFLQSIHPFPSFPKSICNGHRHAYHTPCVSPLRWLSP